jgi:small subunit ribosomal protein S17
MADEETTDNDTEETSEAAPSPEAEVTEAGAPAEAVQDTAAPAAPVAAQPVAVLAPKERRQRARAAKAAKVPARPSRSPEERQAERVAERRKKAEIRRSGRVRAKAKASHEGAATTPPREHVPGVQKVRQGVVVSDKADKTITVRIDTARRHRRYSKIVRTSRTLHAHDERNDANIGDTVIVREARPLSRTKRWRLVRVVERAK